jgi:hypothetical protein
MGLRVLSLLAYAIRSYSIFSGKANEGSSLSSGSNFRRCCVHKYYRVIDHKGLLMGKTKTLSILSSPTRLSACPDTEPIHSLRT